MPPADRSTVTSKTPVPSLDSIHAPVKDQLALVDERMLDLARVSFQHLAGLLEHVTGSLGKRVRPTITLLSAGVHPNDGGNAQTMAVAVELLHIATLVHDDTVDDSDRRRGRATISNLWGKDTAVLLGDYIFAKSATFVCDTGNIRVIKRFAETIMELSSGQLHETIVAYQADQNMEQYLDRIYNKTASLFTTASESGAILSGVSEDRVQALRNYGYNLGMAFQIVDDILDYEGDPEEVGKPVGNDLLHGIVTLPALLYRERNPKDNSIEELFGHPDEHDRLAPVLQAITNSSAIADSNARAEEYGRKALACLTELPKTPERDSLEALVSYVLKRRS
ncbi:MAG: polyprenyl synthetase family protein [Chloroflexi bacterium]|nr:polyprenyl synthetase family protein [Chloroflexota bacterium]